MEKPLTFLIRKILLYSLSFILLTAIIFSFILIGTSAEDRAFLFIPSNNNRMTEAQLQRLLERAIIDNKLDQPILAQYFIWLQSFLKGELGYSPSFKADIAGLIRTRLPATLELTLFSSLFFLPLGITSGLLAAGKKNKPIDISFRFWASVSTTIPTLILAILLIIFFCINLGWFAVDRLSSSNLVLINSKDFQLYTGLITIDGFLNNRPDVSWDAFKHLVLPALTLALPQWGILSRITRTGVLEELKKDYITTARGLGVPEWKLKAQYALKNVTPVVISNTLLSVSMLLTNTYVVEQLFHYPGLSNLALHSLRATPDTSAVLAFAVISISLVLLLMFLLDILLYSFDRRAGVAEIR